MTITLLNGVCGFLFAGSGAQVKVSQLLFLEFGVWLGQIPTLGTGETWLPSGFAGASYGKLTVWLLAGVEKGRARVPCSSFPSVQ